MGGRHRQVGLIPVAYTLGNDFKLGPRQPIEELTYWNGWGDPSAVKPAVV